MERFCVLGVVKHGQVVLDIPLDVPDGTVVAVTDSLPDHVETVGLPGPCPPEVVKALMLALTGRSDLANDPNWEEKIRSRREPATTSTGAD